MLCGKGERPGLGGGPHQRPMGPPPHSEPRIRCRGRGGSCAQPLAKRDFRLFTAGRPRCRAPTIPGGLAGGLGGGGLRPALLHPMDGGHGRIPVGTALPPSPWPAPPAHTHAGWGGVSSVPPILCAPPRGFVRPGSPAPLLHPTRVTPAPAPSPGPTGAPPWAHPQVLSQPPTPPRCEQGVLRAPPPAPQFWLQRPHGMFHPPQPPARVPQMSTSIGGGPQQGPPPILHPIAPPRAPQLLQGTERDGG